NQVVTDGFQVQVTDDHGASAVVPVNITVTGQNDGPTILVTQTTSVLSEDTSAAAAGTVAFRDVDLTDTHTFGATLQAAACSSGGALPAAFMNALAGAMTTSLQDPATGDGFGAVGWFFSIDNNALQFLSANETVTLHYAVAVTDPFAASASRDVVLLING